MARNRRLPISLARVRRIVGSPWTGLKLPGRYSQYWVVLQKLYRPLFRGRRYLVGVVLKSLPSKDKTTACLNHYLNQGYSREVAASLAGKDIQVVLDRFEEQTKAVRQSFMNGHNGYARNGEINHFFGNILQPTIIELERIKILLSGPKTPKGVQKSKKTVSLY